MSRVAYQLKPKGAFHFGREGLEQQTSTESFPSDSLFSALVSMLARVDPRHVEPFLATYLDLDRQTPALRVSSVFPMVGQLPLFPKPRIKIDVDKGNGKDDGSGKALKKIQYVSPQILSRMLSGYSMNEWTGDDKNARYLQNGAIWITKEEVSQLPKSFQPPQNAKENGVEAQMLKQRRVWDNYLVPRVAVDRISNQSNVYQTGRTLFYEGCGLWFMAEVQDQEVEALLDELLVGLGDIGIGGGRSNGHGGFEVVKMLTVPEISSREGSRVMLLSRYCPDAQELENGVLAGESAYELVDVGGWINTMEVQANKRQRIRMIEAGSVLQAQELRGTLVNVTPSHPQPHPIYRSGIALTIPAGGKKA